MNHSRWIRITAVAMAVFTAGSPALMAGTIGAANVAGDFHLDGHPASAHATLSEGALLETGAASGDLDLTGGVRVVMAPGTQGQVYRDRLILLRGAAQFENSNHYVLDARKLRIQASDPKGVASVKMTSSGIEVSALTGPARVTNIQGELLAWVPQGKALSFDVEPAGPKTMHVTGKLLPSNGHAYLVDETTGVKIELKGVDFSNLFGHVVTVTGSVLDETAAEGAAYEISVSSITVAAGAAAGTGVAVAGATKATILGLTAAKAVIIGVAIVSAGTAVAIVKATQSSAPLSQ
jgi:hypothetical protein